MRMRSYLSIIPAAVLACVLSFSLQVTAQEPATDLSDVSLYAGGDLTFDSFSSVEGGATVAVGDVFGSLRVDSIFGEGSLASNGFDDTRGEVFFNGNITGVGGPGSVIDGPVTSVTGDIEIGGSTTVNGVLTAAGSVIQDFNFSTFNGDVVAGGNVEIDGAVNGNVTHGGTLTLGTFATLNGTASSGGAVIIAPFVAPNLTPSSALQANTNNINLDTFEDISLSPGTFGVLNFGSSNTVSLTSGTYVFADIISTFSLNELALDTSGGEIFIYVANSDVSLNLIQSINGVRLFAGEAPDVLESHNVTLEVAGSLTLDSNFYGTLLVPDGDLSLSSDLTGRAFVGGNVDLSGSVVTVPPAPVVLADCDLNGFVNFFDIAPFIVFLKSGIFLEEADCNLDGEVNFSDIAPFLAILTAN